MTDLTVIHTHAALPEAIRDLHTPVAAQLFMVTYRTTATLIAAIWCIAAFVERGRR